MKTIILRALCALLLSLPALCAGARTCRADEHPFQGSYTGSAPRGGGSVTFTFAVDGEGAVDGKIPSLSGRQIDLLGSVSSGGSINMTAYEAASPVYFVLLTGTLSKGANGAVTGRGDFNETTDTPGDQGRTWTARRISAPAARVVLSGRVVNAQGVGIPRVAVLSSGSVIPAVTDARGAYSFADLAPGVYTVTPSLSGLTFAPSALRVTVGAANVTAPPLVAQFQIRGRVSLPDAGAVAGVRITRSGSIAAVTTDASGEFTFAAVPSGAVTLTASKAGLTFTPATQTVRIVTSNPAPITFRTSYAVTGRVLDASGAGIAGVTVSRGGVRVVTDARGGYTFPGLGAATFFVTPSKPGLSFTPSSQRATTARGNVALAPFRGAATSTPGA